MTDEEVMTRVVAILTKTREYVGDDAPEPDSESDVLLNELVKDIFPRSVDIDDDAAPQEVANAIAQAMSGPIFTAFELLSSCAAPSDHVLVSHSALWPLGSNTSGSSSTSATHANSTTAGSLHSTTRDPRKVGSGR
jgi:hypothetical protein